MQQHHIMKDNNNLSDNKILVSPWWFLLYAAVIIITLAIGFIFYNQIPEQVPLNYNLNGEVTKWAMKSYKIILFSPATQLFITIIMFFVYWIIRTSQHHINSKYPKKYAELNRIFSYRWSAFVVFMGLVILLIFVITQLSIIGISNNSWLMVGLPMALGIIIILIAIILSITTGHSGTKIYIQSEKNDDVINIFDKKYWKLGVFYYNPDDPALFIEKRFGVGWTSNFARPISWLIIIGFIIFITLFSIIISLLVK